MKVVLCIFKKAKERKFVLAEKTSNRSFSKAVYICKKKINMIQMKRNVEGNLLLERFVARESSQTLDEKT